MMINLEGLSLGQHQKDPSSNVKSYLTEPSKISLEAEDMGYFTDWGIIELKPEKIFQKRAINISIDSEKWGWYASAGILLQRDGQIIFSENFQSGTKGPIGNPMRFRSYPILEV